MDFLANPLHLTLLIVVLVLLFGASKLGDVGGALGRSIREFKREASLGDDNNHNRTTTTTTTTTQVMTPPPPPAYVPPATSQSAPPTHTAVANGTGPAPRVEYTPPQGTAAQAPTTPPPPPDYVGR
jgi:sec-independent protein translocase protein TatA